MIERTRYEKYTKYTKDGIPHRANGPAYEWENGNWEWWVFGKTHRYYGPACQWNRGWYIHREQIK
jgi:hypothetical protein